MTPTQIFIIILNTLILIEIAYILSYIIKYKKNQKHLKELLLKEDKITQDCIREVAKEEFKYLHGALNELDAVVSNNSLGVNTMAKQATIERSDDLDKIK